MDLTGVDVFAMPEFEHQKSPDLIGMIPSPVHVRFAHLFDQVCIKIAALPEPRTEKGVLHHSLKGATERRADRHGETMLSAMQNIGRHAPIEQHFQSYFGRASLELERSREAHHELNKLLIE